MASPVPSLVTTEWLQDNLKSVKVVDASWSMDKTRDLRKEYAARRIPGAVFFHIDEIADRTTNLPHMLPPAEQFEEQVTKLGISNADHVVAYDSSGTYMASARVWWTFRVFGHNRISVLHGGLLKWIAEGRPLETSPPTPPQESKGFKAHKDSQLVKSLSEMLQNVQNPSFEVIDARSLGRFNGTEDEPRPGLRRGHIPGSRCVPFLSILRPIPGVQVDGVPAQEFLPLSELQRTLFSNDSQVQSQTPIVTTCGSGVTAAIVALGLAQVGREDVAIYDGSWTEYGANPTLPVKP